MIYFNVMSLRALILTLLIATAASLTKEHAEEVEANEDLRNMDGLKETSRHKNSAPVVEPTEIGTVSDEREEKPGQRSPANRIIVGKNAKITDVPSQVLIKYGDGSQRCGGALLDARTIITCAHCFDDGTKYLKSEWKKFYYVAGTATPWKPGVNKQTAYGNVCIHPTYIIKNGQDDVAIVKLSTPFKITSFVKPIRIANHSNDVVEGSKVVISGWGQTDANHQRSNLQMATLLVEKQKTCYPAEKRDDNFCAIKATVVVVGTAKLTPSACHGDSGGPAVCENRKGQFLCGLIKGGACGQRGHPTHFKRVSYYAKWISNPARICKQI